MFDNKKMKILISPNISFGLIAYYIDKKYKKKECAINFLFHKQKDSYAFSDFIRGRYRSNHINNLFKNMSYEELDRIKNFTYDELWNDFWCQYNKSKKIIEDKKDCEKKYNSIRNTILLYTDKYKEIPFGFPKGRKEDFDISEQDAALREFCEETQIPKEKLFITNLPPIIETFYGTDNQLYEIHYFIAECSEKILPEKIKLSDEDKKRLIRLDFVNMETECIYWLNYVNILNTSNDLITQNKKTIIKQIFEKIKI